jgi:hypothetical protein
MVIAWHPKFATKRIKAGETIRGGMITDTSGEWQRCTFHVMRDATREEYIAGVVEAGGIIGGWDEVNDDETRFYLISLD